MLSDLLAADILALKSVAEHLRTADANPDEIQVRQRTALPVSLPSALARLTHTLCPHQEGEDTMLVDSGNAAITLGATLQLLVAARGADAVKEQWQVGCVRWLARARVLNAGALIHHHLRLRPPSPACPTTGDWRAALRFPAQRKARGC